MGGCRNPAGVKGAARPSGPGRTTRWHQAPPNWRPPRGLQGLAGLRDDAPSRRLAARTASGRAGPAAVGDQATGPEGTRNTGGAHKVPPDWRPPRGLQGLVPLVRKAPETPAEHTKYRPIGGRRGACRAWPGFETTRRAKLAARTASGRAGPAAVGDLAELSTAGSAAGQSAPYSPPTPGSGRPV